METPIGLHRNQRKNGNVTGARVGANPGGLPNVERIPNQDFNPRQRTGQIGVVPARQSNTSVKVGSVKAVNPPRSVGRSVGFRGTLEQPRWDSDPEIEIKFFARPPSHSAGFNKVGGNIDPSNEPKTGGPMNPYDAARVWSGKQFGGGVGRPSEQKFGSNSANPHDAVRQWSGTQQGGGVTRPQQHEDNPVMDLSDAEGKAILNQKKVLVVTSAINLTIAWSAAYQAPKRPRSEATPRASRATT